MTTFDFNKHSLPILKINRDRFAGGYYELSIPEGVDPFELAQKFMDSNKFSERA